MFGLNPAVFGVKTILFRGKLSLSKEGPKSSDFRKVVSKPLLICDISMFLHHPNITALICPGEPW